MILLFTAYLDLVSVDLEESFRIFLPGGYFPRSLEARQVWEGLPSIWVDIYKIIIGDQITCRWHPRRRRGRRQRWRERRWKSVMVPYDCKMSIIRPSRRRLCGWMANDDDNRGLNYTETACALELGSAVGPLSDQGTQSTRNGWLAGDGGRGEGGVCGRVRTIQSKGGARCCLC